MRLYRNNRYPQRWYAHSNAMGWVMFPAEPNGWEKREPARGVDPLYTREMPLKLAAGTGIPLATDDRNIPVAA